MKIESFILLGVRLISKTFQEDEKTGKSVTEKNNREYKYLNISPIENIRELGDKVTICSYLKATQLYYMGSISMDIIHLDIRPP